MLRFARFAVPAAAGAAALAAAAPRRDGAAAASSSEEPSRRLVRHRMAALFGAGLLPAAAAAGAGSSAVAFCEPAAGTQPDPLLLGTGSDAEGGASDEPEEEAESLCPGDYTHMEDDKSLQVHPSEGLNFMIQSSVGGSGRDSACVGVNGNISPSGANAVYILVDQRSPTLQAVVQPGQEGKVLKLVTAGKPAPGLSTEGELLTTAAGLQSAKVTAKYSGSDYFATGQLSVPLGGGNPPNGEFSYHQTLAPGVTAGGSLQAVFTPPMLPVPRGVQQLFWGGFGSWTSQRRDSAVFVRYGQQPRAEGGVVETLNVAAWRRATRNLELAADANVVTMGYVQPQASGMGVGARMTFEGGPSGLHPVLTVHVDSGRTVGVSWVKPFAGPGSGTFMRTTLSAVLDHKSRDYKTGAGVEFYY